MTWLNTVQCYLLLEFRENQGSVLGARLQSQGHNRCHTRPRLGLAWLESTRVEPVSGRSMVRSHRDCLPQFRPLIRCCMVSGALAADADNDCLVLISDARMLVDPVENDKITVKGVVPRYQVAVSCGGTLLVEGLRVHSITIVCLPTRSRAREFWVCQKCSTTSALSRVASIESFCATCLVPDSVSC